MTSEEGRLVVVFSFRIPGLFKCSCLKTGNVLYGRKCLRSEHTQRSTKAYYCSTCYCKQSACLVLRLTQWSLVIIRLYHRFVYNCYSCQRFNSLSKVIIIAIKYLISDTLCGYIRSSFSLFKRNTRGLQICHQHILVCFPQQKLVQLPVHHRLTYPLAALKPPV